MKTFNTNMFQSIKEALNKKESGSGSLYTEILKISTGNTYTIRLLPYIKDIEKTFFHYYVHGWVSNATGQYVQAVSPQTFGERDPISEERFRVLRVGSEDEKDKMKNVYRSEKWLVNAYIIDDPTNPENNGTVKMIRYGKQLHKIIMSAIEGEDAEEFGEKIFDLGPDGVNLKLKVEQQGDYPTYVSSRFTTAGKLNLSESQQEEIYNKAFKLEDVFTIKSYDELVQMMNEHIYIKINNDHHESHVEKLNSSNVVEPTKTLDEVADSLTTEDVDELLKDIEF
jgi:hypothetical protein